MKRSNLMLGKIVSSLLKHPACSLLAVYFILVLLVPNASLCHTEHMTLAAGIANILLPLGFYALFLSLFRSTGVGVLVMLPFSILAAFQLVLLYLYGGSIIAVDMFLNVVTTNVSEATELLRNLGSAIILVIVLYLPPLVWGVVTIIKKKELDSVLRSRLRSIGVFAMLAGVVSSLVALGGKRDFSLKKDIFPANVVYNIKIAFDRTLETERYDLTSANFKYDAVSSHDAEFPEVYVMVIGETSRAMNWQLDGYSRPTNPRLSQRDNVVFFSKAISESNTTHKSVPMLMSHVTACNFDSVRCVKSVITAFKEAGFATTFISNQAPNRSYTEFFGDEADKCVYLADTLGRHRYDGEMLPFVEECLKDTCHKKQFIVLHSYGSHFKYQERYPDRFGDFKPDQTEEVTNGTRAVLINSYDNAIQYTDFWLDNLMDILDESGYLSAVVYASDHGEDIMDDSRGRFLHASPTPTYYQLHVAMLVWLSNAYKDCYPEKFSFLKCNSGKRVSPSISLFNTVLDIGGVDTVYRTDSLSVSSGSYNESQYLYLNDMNKGVVPELSGLKSEDMKILHELSLL